MNCKVTTFLLLFVSAALFAVSFPYEGKNHIPVLKVSKGPAGVKKFPIADCDGKRAAVLTNGKEGCVAYEFWSAALKQGEFTPGTLQIKLESRGTGEFGKASLQLSFRKTGGSNGSGGKVNIPVKLSSSWSVQKIAAFIPEKVDAVQYIFSFSGKEKSSWQIANLQFSYAPEQIFCSAAAPDLNLKPSQWKNISAAGAFFRNDTGVLVEQQTLARFAWDKTNLYVGVTAAEPNPEGLSKKIVKRDGPVWEDDTVELFLFDPERDVVKQFIVNPANTQFDCELRQAQAGDPYKVRPWDGKWSSRTWINRDSWEVLFVIPWETLGYKRVPDHPFRVNIARERSAGKECSQWNCFQGRFSEAANYGTLDFRRRRLTRFRRLEKINYIPARKRTVFKELLESKPNNWYIDTTCSEYYLCYQQKEVQKKNDLKSWAPVQRTLLKQYRESGMLGPGLPYTLIPRNTILKLKDLEGLKYPYCMVIADVPAWKAGARPSMMIANRRRVDPAHPESTKTVLAAIDKAASQKPEYRKLIGMIEGVDEPNNFVFYLYSRIRNAESAADIDKVEAEVKARYGFGKYGIPDYFGKKNSDFPFEAIAFWRWWNDRFAKHTQAQSEVGAEKFPGIPNFLYNRNTCSGIDYVDIALCTPPGKTNMVAADPYPTSARAYYGIGRALYHVGYNIKLLRDLAPEAVVIGCLQGFNYNGGAPGYKECREWVSQAMKNGAASLHWYTHSTSFENPPLYKAVVALSKQVSKLPKVKLPETTVTAVYYSDFDCWGLADRVTHAPYMVYTILGEHLGSWFRFVSRSRLDLNGIKVLYIPRMRFTTPELTAKLRAFTEKGGTLVILDPDFLSHNIDGSMVKERGLFTGGPLCFRRVADPALVYGKKQLPLYPVHHLDLPESGRIHGYNFGQLPPQTKVIASYSDGKPAIISYPFGKGKIIFSAVLPFGNSEGAVNSGAWKELMGEIAAEAGEKTDLPIWDFYLPEISIK